MNNLKAVTKQRQGSCARWKGVGSGRTPRVSFLLTKLLLKRLIQMCMLLMVKIFFAISIKILAIYPLVIMKKQIHECLSMFGMTMKSVVKCNFR